MRLTDSTPNIKPRSLVLGMRSTIWSPQPEIRNRLSEDVLYLRRRRERNQQLRAFFDRWAPWRDVYRRRHRAYYDEIARLYRFWIPPGARVLEVGCGTGDLLAQVRPAFGVGIDWSPAMVRIARAKYPHLHFAVADAEALSLRGTFDYVILSDLLGYVEDVQAVLEQVRSVCAPHTRVVLNFYNALWEPAIWLGEKLRWKFPASIRNWLSLQDVENLLYLTSFEVVARGRRLLFPLRIPLLSSILNRWALLLPGVRRLGLIQWCVARPMPWEDHPPGPPPSVSVVVPVRNEAGNIEEIFQRVPEMGAWTELVFVDGASTDGTVEAIEACRVRYPERRVQLIHQGAPLGKADAVRKGFAAARGDVLMILDGDLTVPPEDLPKFYEALVRGRGEFINGSRLVYPMEKGAMRFFNLLGNKFFSMAFTWLLQQPIKDTLCGTKVLYRRDYDRIRSLRGYFGDFDPFGDFELLFGAAKLGLRIVDLPIRYQERTYGTTKIHRWRHGWLLLRMCLVALWRLRLG